MLMMNCFHKCRVATAMVGKSHERFQTKPHRLHSSGILSGPYLGIKRTAHHVGASTWPTTNQKLQSI